MAVVGVVQHKDIELALLGASAGLAGLVLVFLGLVASATSSFPPGTKPDIMRRARRPVWAILGSFALGIACVAAATAWLVFPDHNGGLYQITVVLFVAQLVSLVAATAWAVRRSMWG